MLVYSTAMPPVSLTSVLADITNKKGLARRKLGSPVRISGRSLHETLVSFSPFRQDENRLLRRKEQNRAAQRAFRERKEKHVKDVRCSKAPR